MTMLRPHAKPVLTRDEIPDVPPTLIDATSAFNPGACRLDDGRALMLLRVQSRGRRTYLMRALEDSTGQWKVDPELVEITGLEKLGCPVHHVYDPRITRLESRWYVTCALDLEQSCRVGIFTTEDFRRLDLLGVTSSDDTRNGVLFPETIDGRYLLLDRPNTHQPDGGAATGNAIVLRSSSDLMTWETMGPVFSGRWHYWDELIGAGPPPVKTEAGWLLIYHGVATHLGTGLYQAGAALLDLADPRKVLGRTRDNILEPRQMWEMVGQVPNVVFPSGLLTVPPREDGTVPLESTIQVMYGAADTCIGVATGTVAELLGACR